MTEPVAYKIEDVSETLGWRYSTLKPVNKNYVPLYTSEQLHPRVKMTQAEFDEWKELDFENNIFGLLSQLLDDVTEPDYQNLTKRIYGTNGDGIEDNYKQIELANLFIDYNPDNPDETIEIVPDMKWFVRVDSQIPLPDENIYLDDELIVYPHYDSPKSSAHQFDTKSEAEKWTNPLTEAVQLPVEGE